MTPERWKKVEEVFDAVLERAPAERTAFLEAACGTDSELRQQVETLVRSLEQAGSFIEQPVVDGVLSPKLSPETASASFIGKRVGSYRLVQEIGRGGMGAVYLAVRADDEFQKRVAIKLVKRGMDTDFILRRFRQERQILASLDHPNIARLFDGGTTEDGLPFFVMEYIQGLPINTFCDAQKLSTVERLRLFSKVCSAVSHAHQNLIIHRDLKPSNVLVTPEGTPKLLDFGIAKLLNPEMGSQTLDPTTVAMRLMTPEYASPEQVRGEIVTVASDVYSLGVLLYELLTGHRPYRLKNLQSDELARVICEQEPERPSIVINLIEVLPSRNGGPLEITPESVSRTRDGSLEKLRRQLAGSLDNVVLKALRKEPHRRYQTVEELSDDIKRHLEGHPVSAPAYYPLTVDSRHDTAEPSTGPKAIAVLPFKTLRAEDKSDEYLGMGMADALITKLSNIQRIIVRPTSSVIKYFDGETNAVIAGHELEADYVLDGRVQRVGDRVRVTVQLVRVRDAAPLWAEKFDEKFTDIFAVEDSISEQVAEALMPRLSGEEKELLRKRDTDNPDAYQAYMRGRYFWSKFTDAGFARALDCFREAIRQDPDYALAYVGLADYYNWAAIFGMGSPAECFPQAKEAAIKALELDESLAEAHAALAFTTLCFDWDADLAQSRFERSFELNSHYAPAHSWYSNLLIAQGLLDKGVAEARKSQALSPLSLMDRSLTAWACYQARRYDEAYQELQQALDMDKNFGQGAMVLATVLERMGEYDKSIAAAERAVQLMEGAMIPLWILGYSLASAGRVNEARDIVNKLLRLSEQTFVSPYFIAMIYVALGEFDTAMQWLEKAYESRDEWLVWLGTEPKLDPLRNDPRFMELVNRVGLYDPTVARSVERPLNWFETNPSVDRSNGLEVHQGLVGNGQGELALPSVLGLGGPSVTTKQLPADRTQDSIATRPINRRALMAAIVVILLVLVGYSTYRAFFSRKSGPAFLAPVVTKLITSGNAVTAALSGDGKYVAYAVDETGKQSLWLRQVAVTNSVKRIAPADISYLGMTFSPDSTYVYYVASPKNGDGALYKLPTLGGSEIKVKDRINSPVGLSPDGKQIAFVRTNTSPGQDALIIANEDGSGERIIGLQSFPNHFSTFAAPAWSPDGRSIAMVIESADKDGFLMRLVRYGLTGEREEPITQERWNQINQPAWLPDQSGLIMAAMDPKAMFTQVVQIGYPDGQSRKVLADLSNYRTISLSADGRSFVAVQRQTISNVHLATHDAPELATQITSGAGRYFDVAWTSDGNIIYASDASGSAEIWEMESNGANQRPITNGAGRNYAPTVTPDGRSILFHSNRSGTWQVWKMDREGSNPRQLTEGSDNCNWPAVSPDGRWVVYDRVGEGSLTALWKMPIDGGMPVRLTSQLSTRASVSPDGKYIAYWQKDQQPNALWRIAVVGFDGGTPIAVFDVPQSPANAFTPLRWTENGRAIAYADYRNGTGKIWVQPIAGGAAREFISIPNNQLFAFDISSDGRFIYSRGPTTDDIILVKDGS